jgi:hypothetical protein
MIKKWINLQYIKVYTTLLNSLYISEANKGYVNFQLRELLKTIKHDQKD